MTKKVGADKDNSFRVKKYSKYLGLIILGIIVFQINMEQLYKSILLIKIEYLLLAIIMNIPQIFIKSLRWNYLLRQQNIQYSIIHSFLIYFSSIYVGFITPGRIGEFVKVLYLKSERGIGISRGFSSVLVDRLFDLYLLILVGSVAIWKLNLFGKLSISFYMVSWIVVLLPLLVLRKSIVTKIIKIIYKVAVFQKVKDRVEDNYIKFYDNLYRLLNLRLFASALLTIIGYSLFIIQCYLIVLAMSLPVNILTLTLFMSISNLISFIPISISGLGTRDMILIYLFSLIGVGSELAVAYAFFVFITFFIFGGIFGALAWWLRPLSLTERSKYAI